MSNLILDSDQFVHHELHTPRQSYYTDIINRELCPAARHLQMVDGLDIEKTQGLDENMPGGDMLFAPYMRLPIELRYMIQKCDTETPRVISLRIQCAEAEKDSYGQRWMKPTIAARHYRVPTWLHVHQESRNETMKSFENISYYENIHGSSLSESSIVNVLDPPMYFNPKIDNLHFLDINDVGLIQLLRPTLKLQPVFKQIQSISLDSSMMNNQYYCKYWVSARLNNYLLSIREVTILGTRYKDLGHEEQRGKEITFGRAVIAWEDACLDRAGYIRTGDKKCLEANGFSQLGAIYEKTDGPWRLPSTRFGFG